MFPCYQLSTTAAAPAAGGGDGDDDDDDDDRGVRVYRWLGGVTVRALGLCSTQT